MRTTIKFGLIFTLIICINSIISQANAFEHETEPNIFKNDTLFVAEHQSCGYFAILGCFSTAGEALGWSDRIEAGHVIDTSDHDYPAFRTGFFCVVHGPTFEETAKSIAQNWKRKYVRDAYVKRSC